MLLGEVVEIEALGLTIFVMDDFQVGDRTGLRGKVVAATRLFALRFTLRLLRPLFLAGAFLLSLGESCTRASCHNLETTHV